MNWIPTDPLARLPTKSHIHPRLLHIVCEGNAHLLPIRIQKTPYQGFWRSEVHVRRLRIRIVSQGVTCVHSVGLGICLLFRMCLLTDPHGSTLSDREIRWNPVPVFFYSDANKLLLVSIQCILSQGSQFPVSKTL